MSYLKNPDVNDNLASHEPISDRLTAEDIDGGHRLTDNSLNKDTDIQTVSSGSALNADSCETAINDSDVLDVDLIQEVKPILKRKSLDETEIKTLPSILKKNHSFEWSSKQAVLKRHSLGSEWDHRNPALLMSAEIDITSPTPSSSSSRKPSSRIHSILKHKSLDEKCVQSARDDYNLPKPILKKNLSIEDEIEKCLSLTNLNNGSANGSNHSVTASSSGQSTSSPMTHPIDGPRNTRSILKTGSEQQLRVRTVMTRPVEVKGILKTGHKNGSNDSKPVKSALKKSDQSIENKSEVKSILKSESIGSNEMINTSDSNSSSGDEGIDADNPSSTANAIKGEDHMMSSTSNNGCSDDNHHKSNGNSVETPNSCALRDTEENPNQRFLLNNRRLDHKRPASCITMSTTNPIVIDGEPPPTSSTASAADVRKSVSGSISERLAALKHNGEENWKKRISKVDDKDVVLRVPTNGNKAAVARNRATSIAERMSLLEDSSVKWKNRVEDKDVKQFTVEGKLSETDIVVTKTPDIQRKTPKAVPFRSEKTAEMLNSMLKKDRQVVVPKVVTTDTSIASDTQTTTQCSKANSEAVVVSVQKTDDEEFNSFFNCEINFNTNGANETISDESFDKLGVGVSNLLTQKRASVRPQTRRKTSSNPIRSLNARTDFTVESYVETPVMETIKTDDNISLRPKKSKDLVKSSSFAASALAGLASREDFKAVAGKLRSSGTASSRDSWKSYDMPNSIQSLMVVQIKGRRRAQTRLVEPDMKSMNAGDCYILVSRERVIVLIGLFSNVIEKTKALEVANQIQEKKDLCFRSSNPVVVIDCQKPESISPRNRDLFLTQLGAKSMDSIGPPGNTDEDEVYEDTIIGTNMIYRVNNEQLVPYEEYWGRVPRYEMLDTDQCYVFDMGSEMYVWVGNRAESVVRKCALDAAKELWNKGYDYGECDLNPFGVNAANKSDSRPKWSWFTKVSQNMESILFKDKFFDWPSVKATNNGSKYTPLSTPRSTPKHTISRPKDIYSELSFSAIDAKAVIADEPSEPDMILEMTHLGRGVRWDDELEGRHITITPLDVKCWLISEYEKHDLLAPDMYCFYSGDTYVVRWHYRMSRVGRQLRTGDVSRHSMIGRDRSCYFFWHGLGTKSTEKGASALMTIELDKEKAQQVRVSEHREEPCFLNIFNGSFIILRGKRGQTSAKNNWQLFYVRGVVPNEATLVEVEPRVQSLRSRTAFAFINPSSHTIYVWFGCKCLDETRKVMHNAIDRLITHKPPQIGLKVDANYVTKELDEGKEDKEFWDLFESQDRRQQRQRLYHSLIDSRFTYDFTPRLFHLTSSSGEFTAKEILCSYRSVHNVTPYPFTQEDIYSAQQPTFFLFDNCHQIFLWESKYAFSKEATDDSEANATTGSQTIRWSAERKCALDSAIAYCFAKNSAEPPNGFVVCAGLEPDSFCALFPQWTYREDVALLHQQDGRKPGEMLAIQEVLSQYKTQYSLEELTRRPLPEGLNELCLESYLGADDFRDVLGVSREEFYDNLPIWRQTQLKQKANLF